MRAVLVCLLLTCAIGGICWAARCTTVAEPTVLREYQDYVARAEDAMLPRFDSSELSWVAGSAAKQTSAKLASGEWVRRNISDAALNQRIASQNGTVIHWIGAIRIRGASLANLNTVLEDYDHYDRIYQPMMFGCKAERNGDERRMPFMMWFSDITVSTGSPRFFRSTSRSGSRDSWAMTPKPSALRLPHCGPFESK